MSLFKKTLMHALICLVQFTSLYSQTPSYYHYTTTNGLASATVFDILQDKDGFIWFATLNGLSKFDGRKFTTFKTSDGLNSNVVTCLLEGDEGEIYIGNNEKGIDILKNGNIRYFRTKVRGTTFNTRQLLRSQGNIFTFMTPSVMTINEKAANDSSDNIIYTSPVFINRLGKLQDNQIIALTTHGLFKVDKTLLRKMKVNGLPDAELFCFTSSNDGSYFVGAKGFIYRIKNNSVVRKYVIDSYNNQKVFFMLKDSNNNLWFSLFGKGFFVIPDGSDKIINVGIKMGLEKTQIDGLIEDAEKNIWIITFGKGVYCLNNLYIKNYTDKDGLINNNVNCIVKEKSGKLLLGTINGLNIFENGSFEQVKYGSGKVIEGYISDVVSSDDYIYVCQTTEESALRNFSYNGKKYRMLRYQSFCKTSGGFYLIGFFANKINVQRELDYQPQNSWYYIFGDSAKLNRINRIYEDSRKNVWVGSNLGLCKISNLAYKAGKVQWDKTFFPNNTVLSSKITSIFQDKNNIIWFVGDNGIASYNLSNDSVKSYTKINEYDLSSCTSITSDNKNRIWIGNLKGLYLYDGNSPKFLNSKTGLTTDEVLSLYYDDKLNSLYVGTSNGISVIDINLFDNYKQLSLNVKVYSIKAGDSVYTNYNNLVFEPEQHDVSINFKAIHFSSPGSVTYKFKLNDDEWKVTDYDFLNFISLQNGTYNLQIMAKAQNTEWSKPYFLSFRILPRFSETIWFYVGIISIFIFIALYIVIWRLRIRNKKMVRELDLSERINDLKHQALSAMMNPHFIFNSLNSVQYLINSQRNEEANDYIAMMAKLIRKNLDTAGSGFILLSEEINRLKLYLDLEKLRFQEKFTYEIIIGSGIETESVMIPNMIIQPFVENSLWHGIINSGKNGFLTISFLFENIEIDSAISKSLMIKVTDNGIGILQAQKNKKEDHISKGIQIIEERLKLLSTKMELPKPIMLEDLSERNSSSHGTEVIISLSPPMYKFLLTE